MNEPSPYVFTPPRYGDPIARPPLGGYLTEWPRGNSYENRIPTVSYKATFVVSDARIQIDSAILDRETFE
jgi:hypothetical protein